MWHWLGFWYGSACTPCTCTHTHTHPFGVPIGWSLHRRCSYGKSNPVRRVTGDELGERALLWGWGELFIFCLCLKHFLLQTALGGIQKEDLFAVVCSRTRIPVISAAPFFVLLAASSQAFLRPTQKFCSCWKSVGTKCSAHVWLCPFEKVCLLFSSVQTQKEDFLLPSSSGLDAERQHWGEQWLYICLYIFQMAFMSSSGAAVLGWLGWTFPSVLGGS